MSVISVDIKSTKPDLDALVELANTKIAELQAILAQITSFQLAFNVNEVPATAPDTSATE